MSQFKITPILNGEFPSFEKSAFTYLKNAGEKLRTPIPVWLLQDGNQNILVDSGIGDKQLVDKYHYPVIKPKEYELDQALKAHGLTPDDISLVIWTHLHWDHCQNARMFENAKFIVQKKEIQYAVAPYPVHKTAYEIGIKGLRPEWLDVMDSIEVIDGDTEIVDGIKMLLHPGHSPGFQSVLVEGKSDRYLIAGDNIPLLANWNAENPMTSIPNGIHLNLTDYYETFQKIGQIKATILPGHDFSIFEQPYYY